MAASAYRLPLSTLVDLLRFGSAEEELSAATGNSLIVTNLDTVPDVTDIAILRTRMAALPCVLVGIISGGAGEATATISPLFDVVLAESELSNMPAEAVIPKEGLDIAVSQLARIAGNHPIACSSLAMLLRRTSERTIDDGLAAESAVYSMLQAGPEFRGWLSTRPRGTDRELGEPAVLVSRNGAELLITLNHPAVHNAFTTRMRDELLPLLALAAADSSITRIILEGAGPSFCSGGYLKEFGLFSDPATAHTVRLTRNAGRQMARIASRLEVHLHGVAMGAGIELAAFAHYVVADPSTRIALPEVALGLVPGAGGTVSLPRRIGRHRTMYLALAGTEIDAKTALAWGLVDDVRDREEW
jgi:enoyl-CoA hydratase/carnithine racemase